MPDGVYFNTDRVVTEPTCSKFCTGSRTPIKESALSNHARCFEYLVNLAEDRHSSSREMVDWNQLLANVAEKGCDAVVQVMLDLKTSSAEEFGIHGLQVAAFFGQLPAVEILVENGIDVNTTDNYGFTSLYYACRNGHFFVVNYLIEHGADLSIRADHGRQCLHEASITGHLTICNLLIEKSADVNAVDDDRCTPLHGACVNDNSHIVISLLARGSNVNARDVGGRTALWYACRFGYVECVEVLLGRNADTAIFSKSGDQALHMAAQNGHCRVLELLLSHGAEMVASRKSHKTPIELALCKGQEKAAKILRAKGGPLPAKFGATRRLEDLELEKSVHKRHLGLIKDDLILILHAWRPAYLLWFRNIMTSQKHHSIFENKDPIAQNLIFYDILQSMTYSEYKKVQDVLKELKQEEASDLLEVRGREKRRSSAPEASTSSLARQLCNRHVTSMT